MITSHQKQAEKIQSILLENFNIEAEQFDWEKPLEELDKQFKVLGNLVFLEQLIQKEFNKDILLLENITTSFHTPKDVLQLIINNL
ncbi:MAG: hypothetical protein AB8G15_11965 [Saprospiraceae bacterium]